jgi:predicted dehydrogenase
MPNDRSSSRRKFLQQLSSSTLLLSAGSLSSLASKEKAEEHILHHEKKISSNDKIRIAGIGMGIMGFNDVNTALKVPGVEMVAACDLYTGRLERAQEVYGSNLITTKDYRELLNRKDIDAVIIATGDHWHARIAMDAMNAGKAVYCEKPMVHKLSEGLPVIEVQKKTGRVLQVGSQRVSSIELAKARELYQAGEIGQLNCIESTYDRQSALGAWQYTMPLDASPQTVDWDRYISNASSKRPYDPKRFFWWRNYQEYGTGMSGDLFVHLVSGIHLITGSMGPEKIFSTGQLSYWKDGRDVPDVMTAIMDYPSTKEHPAFQVMLRVNFISGGGDRGVTRFIGSEGVIDLGWSGITVTRNSMPKAPGIGGWDALSTYPKEMQKKLLKQYGERYSEADRKRPVKPPINFKAPQGYNEHLDHFTNFFDGVRTGKPVVEGPEFGFRAAAPCLAANDSYFQKKVVHWDPVKMKLKLKS